MLPRLHIGRPCQFRAAESFEKIDFPAHVAAELPGIFAETAPFCGDIRVKCGRQSQLRLQCATRLSIESKRLIKSLTRCCDVKILRQRGIREEIQFF